MAQTRRFGYIAGMNDIERRALIGAAGIGAIAALSKAGPLNPPAGAVTGTGRTLDEVYNRIATPPAVGGYDGRRPIPGGSTPYIIATPGSYVLTGNLTTSGTAITVSVDNVTIDLNGFTVANTLASGQTFVANTVSNICLRNGRVTGGAYCINFQGVANDCIVEDIQTASALNAGIIFGNSSSRGCIVRRCTAGNIGSTSTASSGNMSLWGIYFAGLAGRVEDCTVTRLVYNGSGTPTYIGIFVPAAGAVTGNCVSNCTISQLAATTGIGLLMGGNGLYRNNTVLHFTTAFSTAGSANGGGNSSI